MMDESIDAKMVEAAADLQDRFGGQAADFARDLAITTEDPVLCSFWGGVLVLLLRTETPSQDAWLVRPEKRSS